MALTARKIEAEDSMEARISRLEAHVEHIQADVQDLRQDMKGLRQEMKEQFAEINEKFDRKFGELQKAIESMKLGRVWDRVWMLLAMGALLGVMARGFKWI